MFSPTAFHFFNSSNKDRRGEIEAVAEQRSKDTLKEAMRKESFYRWTEGHSKF